MSNNSKGGFTLPGEAGYEALTLQLAERWGADVIRDSDGTVLSDDILQAGYDIYSTVCIIRDHNAFLQENPQYQQQCFLMTKPVTAQSSKVTLPLLAQYSTAQFEVNSAAEALAWWQVFDRTTGSEVPRNQWRYDAENGTVVMQNAEPWHTYTANFLALRIWEEISMYNHVTNHWTGEHLRQLDPVYPEVQSYLCEFLERWCVQHPTTTVVRLTSLFYNFVWIWGAGAEQNSLYTDWAAYDFTVSPHMLQEFAKVHGYALSSEDFIAGGMRHSCQLMPSKRQMDYLQFVNGFVTKFGKQLVDIVHRHGKQAYLFYDDSWVGTEPGGKRFAEFGFDGIIKCVFSGYEARLCSTVQGVKVHELRLHPYLFPVGLGGAPTFAQGGHPGRDALDYWAKVRRALLREPVDRIGLGGYLHLVQQYPDFLQAMDRIVGEFATIRALHTAGAPEVYPCKIGVVTAWGKLRRWTCGGHYHEHPELDLINVLESLAGLPFTVEFFSLDELAQGIPQDVQVLINAGFAGSAWSGGDGWAKAEVQAAVTQFVHEGGVLLGIGEPSAVPGGQPFFRMAHVLGVDSDQPALLAHGKIEWKEQSEILPFLRFYAPPSGVRVRLQDKDTQVLRTDSEGKPAVTSHTFGRGCGVYFSGYRHSAQNAQMLHALLLHFACKQPVQSLLCSAPGTECHVFEAAQKIVLVNNLAQPCETSVQWRNKQYCFALEPFGCAVLEQ